jgi:hypothetical protein
MFNQARINDLQRKYWLDAQARGQNPVHLAGGDRSILIWLIVLPAVQLSEDHGHLFSPQFLVISLVMLPIFLPGGYLTGNWKWKDLEKKYPEYPRQRLVACWIDRIAVKLTRCGLCRFIGVIVNLMLEASNLDQTGEPVVDSIVADGESARSGPTRHSEGKH